MSKGRLEAFSDGVIAILITIMVLELHPPEQTDLEALRPLVPVFISYVLSFVYLGIYWNNHHHLLQSATVVDGRVLWANLVLLFWLSLVPFATAWMGQDGFASVPTALYGCVLIAAAFAYTLLVRTLRARAGAVGDRRSCERRRPQGHRVHRHLCRRRSWSRWWPRSWRSRCTWSWRSSGSSPTGVSSAPWAAEPRPRSWPAEPAHRGPPVIAPAGPTALSP